MPEQKNGPHLKAASRSFIRDGKRSPHRLSLVQTEICLGSSKARKHAASRVTQLADDVDRQAGEDEARDDFVQAQQFEVFPHDSR